MKRIGIIANCRKEHAPGVLAVVSRKAEALGLVLVACDETGDHLPNAERVNPDSFGNRIDALMALGGDGTMLRAVRLLGGADKPVIGVNLGSLGFMTSVTEEQADRAVDALASGTFEVSERSMLDCRVTRKGAKQGAYTALNDVVIGWGTSSRVIVLDVSVNGEDVTSYVCDGLIVSTPTGSTGHSLSAWGPIMHPESPVILLNVICPHTLSARPLVLPEKCDIAVRVAQIPAKKTLLLSADGQGELPLEQGDVVEVRRHPQRVRFIHLRDYSYFSVLRQKLHWRGSNT